MLYTNKPELSNWHIVSHRMLRKQGSSNPAAHNPIAVFLPHSFDPLLPFPSDAAATSSSDSFELEATAIKLFAEIHRSRWSNVSGDWTHIICKHERIVVGGEAVRGACEAESERVRCDVVFSHAISVIVSLCWIYGHWSDIFDWNCDLSESLGSHSRDRLFAVYGIKTVHSS